MAKRREHSGRSIVAFPEQYVVVDIETTGLNPKNDSIIEISALRFNHGELMNEYVTLIDPGIHISSFISNLTGITDSMVENKDDIYLFLSKSFRNMFKMMSSLGTMLVLTLVFYMTI